MNSPDKPSIWMRLREFMDRPWYMPMIGALAALDLFIMVIPTDGLMVTSVLVRPKRWVRSFLYVSFGSALGAALLAAIIHIDPDWIKDSLLWGTFHSQTWFETEAFIAKHGNWALVLIAWSIFPQQPAVAIAALGGMSVVEVTVAVFVGRAVKYSVLAYLASKSPDVVKRLWFIRKEIERFES